MPRETSNLNAAMIVDAAPFSGSLQQIARTAVKFQERRRKILGAANFADPAWDLLLFLAANDNPSGELSCRFVATKIGISVAVVERFAQLLERQGIVQLRAKSGDPSVSLTARGAETLQQLIS